MIITSVERNKRNKDTLLVYIDGSFAFSIREEDYIALNLYAEREITKDEIERVKNEINLRAAKSTAVKFLSLKTRCEKEVRDKLESEGFDLDTIDGALSYLISIGYINDKVYAQKYISDRYKLKPKSKKLLKAELIHKGIDEKIAQEILSESEMDEEEVALNVLKKKFGKYDLNDEKIFKKAYAFLLHRGFHYELIYNVINKIRNG
ncbi:MAG: recombination regulator RecX [Clostridia bacterium]|nr:recombination regulator RecX [Clostridia bacterium]